jgi:ubiquinone/menaquinone biosynthesis C-methylase UbiE
MNESRPKRHQKEQKATPVTGFFEGDRLELNWRYVYRPEFIPLLMDYLGARPGMRILDVGCGSGFLSRLLARTLEDVHVVGLEADEKLLDLAHQMVEREGLTGQVELHQGDAYHLPFSDDSFDLVTSHTVL